MVVRDLVFLLKVLGVSVLLGALIKYGGPLVIASPSLALALALVFGPVLVLAVLLMVQTLRDRSAYPHAE